jgi:phosphoglycerate kinase
VFERPPFARGTFAIAQALGESQAFTVVGGGESVEAVRKAGVAQRLGHLSTGGGASLEFLAGANLPGVAALEA